MINKSDYNLVASNTSELTNDLSDSISSEISSSIGTSIGKIFPGFAVAFPHTASAIEQGWNPPILAIKNNPRARLCYIISEGANLNLIFKLKALTLAGDEGYFLSTHAMLPTKWRELYRLFDSFCVSELSTTPSNWWNTPFRYSSRLDLSEYCKGAGVSSKSARAFEGAIGSSQLMCWLLTEAGDALFIDEQRCDQKIYHVRGAELEDFSELSDPAAILDKYLAHYVSGGDPEKFDFRC